MPYPPIHPWILKAVSERPEHAAAACAPTPRNPSTRRWTKSSGGPGQLARTSGCEILETPRPPGRVPLQLDCPPVFRTPVAICRSRAPSDRVELYQACGSIRTRRGMHHADLPPPGRDWRSGPAFSSSAASTPNLTLLFARYLPGRVARGQPRSNCSPALVGPHL